LGTVRVPHLVWAYDVGRTASASAAVANALYHAIGKRIRDLPTTPERLFG
jgi:hypothetical protein